MNDEQIAKVFESLGNLTQSVESLRGQIEIIRSDMTRGDTLARENRARVYERIEEVSHQIIEIDSGLSSVKQTIENDVLPTIRKVKSWEQRGVGFLAAIGLAGTVAGVLLNRYWEDILKFVANKH